MICMISFTSREVPENIPSISASSRRNIWFLRSPATFSRKPLLVHQHSTKFKRLMKLANVEHSQFIFDSVFRFFFSFVLRELRNRESRLRRFFETFQIFKKGFVAFSEERARRRIVLFRWQHVRNLLIELNGTHINYRSYRQLNVRTRSSWSTNCTWTL